MRRPSELSGTTKLQGTLGGSAKMHWDEDNLIASFMIFAREIRAGKEEIMFCTSIFFNNSMYYSS